MLEQLARRRDVLGAGATHVGWKLGVGDRERIGGSIVVGHLTSAACLGNGGEYRVDGLAADLRVDAELAVELRAAVDPTAGTESARAAIGAWAPALEIVDLAPVLGDPTAIVATNVFHRAVAFGEWQPGVDEAIRGVVRINGRERRAREAPTNVAERVLAGARVLDAVGHRLARGDRLITGSIMQVPVVAGDEVEADFGSLGAVRLRVVA